MTAITAKAPAWPVLAATLALLAALALAFWLVEPLNGVASAAFDGDGALVRSRTQALGVAGALVLLALVLAHAAIPYPSEITTAAAGYVYGFGLGFALMMVSWFLTALLAYELAREVGRPAARRLIGERRLAKAEEFVDRGGPTALIASRFVPLIPFNAVCYAAGITGVPRAALRLDDGDRHRAVLPRRHVPRQPPADRRAGGLAAVGHASPCCWRCCSPATASSSPRRRHSASSGKSLCAWAVAGAGWQGRSEGVAP